METRRLLLLSDLHVGSTWGIFPKNFKTSGGNVIILNKLQEELLTYWNDLQKRVGQYDTVVLLGDLVQGLNKKESGKHLIISDLNEQKQAAITLLKPFCKNKIVVGISGSSYHNSVDYELEKDIVQYFNGAFGGAVANYTIGNTGKTINIRHGKGALTYYAGTKMDKEIKELLISERLGKLPGIDIIALGHYHTMAHYYINEKLFVLNACWEGPRYNLYTSGNFFKYQPDIGATKLIVTEDYIKVKPYTYKLKSVLENIRTI